MSGWGKGREGIRGDEWTYPSFRAGIFHGADISPAGLWMKWLIIWPEGLPPLPHDMTRKSLIS